MEEVKYSFEDEHQQSKLQGFLTFLWNSRTKEFCGRDGASWAKVTFFYSIFYTLLGGFFIGMLAVFMSVIPLDKPTYYGESSSMSVRGLNPGLGFRPQINPEDHTIKFNPTVDVDALVGVQLYKRNLDIYLNAKYPEVDDNNLVDCEFNKTYHEQFSKGKSCKFDYKGISEAANCTSESSYGYKIGKPCVLVKVNKIVSWEPKSSGYIRIKCEGENAFDKDNLLNVEYHYEYLPDETEKPNKDEGKIQNKHFPFMGQKTYRQPFVWAVFEVSPNTLVNVECKAYADNIDNTDRLNRRGQTKFTLFVANN